MMTSTMSSASWAVTATRLVIVVFGLISVACAIAYFPLGLAFAAVAAVGAIFTRNLDRVLLLCISGLALLITAALLLLLVQTGGTVTVSRTTPM